MLTFLYNSTFKHRIPNQLHLLITRVPIHSQLCFRLSLWVCHSTQQSLNQMLETRNYKPDKLLKC